MRQTKVTREGKKLEAPVTLFAAIEAEDHGFSGRLHSVSVGRLPTSSERRSRTSARRRSVQDGSHLPACRGERRAREGPGHPGLFGCRLPELHKVLHA